MLLSKKQFTLKQLRKKKLLVKIKKKMLQKEDLINSFVFMGKYNFIFKKLNKKNQYFYSNPKFLLFNYLTLKTIRYNLLKEFKNSRKQYIKNCNNNEFRQFNFSKLQFSKVYTSLIEKRKKSYYWFLRLFLKKTKKIKKQKKNLKPRKKISLKTFERRKKKLSKGISLVKFIREINWGLKFNSKARLKFKIGSTRLIRSTRGFKLKKKVIYKKPSDNLKKFKNLFYRTLKKFRRKKKRLRYKLKRKIRWRRKYKKFVGCWITQKKNKKRKKFLKILFIPIFKYYRNRHRLYFRFYVPKYLEINYKTFCFTHLDTLDHSSIGYKIPLSLNLGKVQTKISY